MSNGILGIHHVTAIAGSPQRNIDFYSGLLGLRLVKVTVNFDDPSAYHLYYGDESGQPGTILTFFTWPSAPQGKLGTGQLTVTSFAIPLHGIQFWTELFKSRGVEYSGPKDRFGEEKVLSFSDPDGLQLELVATDTIRNAKAWKHGPIPEEYAIRDFLGVTLSEQSHAGTEELLAQLGFHQKLQHKNSYRFAIGGNGVGGVVDVLHLPTTQRGQIAVGTVHHVAWRTPDDEEQKNWRTKLLEAGLKVTPIIDRKYFHSIYFREPGGVLFEIATDPPGFAVDETPEQLGSELKLPPWLESSRKEIAQALPPIQLPRR
jgi:catechol 2,3-dioxygenase-like lactoylglutathione lyase family enzyme